MTRPRVACLGECMLEVGVQPDAAQFGFGGDTLNTAVYLARAGIGAEYVTALGTDPLSDEMLARWQSERVATTHVLQLDTALPGLYVIRTDEVGERSFYYWRDQAAVRQLLDGDRARTLAARLAGVDLLYLSGITLAIFEGDRRDALLGLLESLRADGTHIAFDTNYRPRLWPDAATARAAYARVAALTDVALAGIEDEAALHGDAMNAEQVLERWRDAGASEGVVRCGEHPALAWQGARVEEIPPPARLSPVDTTAAGDAFNAAYLAARLAGEPQPQAVARGHALAGHVVMHRGAIVG